MVNYFMAKIPNQKNPYFQRFIAFMHSIDNGKSIVGDWNLIEKTSDENSDKIISHLIDLI